MAGLADFPQLWRVFQDLQNEKARILAQSAPLRAEYNQIQEQYDMLNARMRQLAEAFHSIERPRLGEIDNQLGAIARATGGRSTSQ